MISFLKAFWKEYWGAGFGKFLLAAYGGFSILLTIITVIIFLCISFGQQVENPTDWMTWMMAFVAICALIIFALTYYLMRSTFLLLLQLIINHLLWTIILFFFILTISAVLLHNILSGPLGLIVGLSLCGLLAWRKYRKHKQETILAISVGGGSFLAILVIILGFKIGFYCGKAIIMHSPLPIMGICCAICVIFLSIYIGCTLLYFCAWITDNVNNLFEEMSEGMEFQKRVLEESRREKAEKQRIRERHDQELYDSGYKHIGKVDGSVKKLRETGCGYYEDEDGNTYHEDDIHKVL